MVIFANFHSLRWQEWWQVFTKNKIDRLPITTDFSAIKKGYFDALNKEYFEFIKYNHWDFIHPVDLTADYVKRGSKLKQISFKAGILKDTVKFLMNYNNSEIIIILDISKNKVTNTGCTHPSKYVNMD